MAELRVSSHIEYCVLGDIMTRFGALTRIIADEIQRIQMVEVVFCVVDLLSCVYSTLLYCTVLYCTVAPAHPHEKKSSPT